MEDQPEDRLEILWRQLGAQLKEKEAELHRLRERFKKLDDARSVLLDTEITQTVFGDHQESPSSNNEPHKDITPSLKNATLAYVNEFAGHEGKSPSAVTAALTERGYGSHVTARVFYSMVYLTLTRLVEEGELRSKKGPRGRLFVASPKSKNLFPAEHAEQS